MNRQSQAYLEARTAARAGSAAGVSAPHESAHLHVAGRFTSTTYPKSTHAAPAPYCAERARGGQIDRSLRGAAPGVVAVLSAADIPGPNDCGPIVHDEPILAEGKVQYLGQPVFAVIAETRELARRAAAKARVLTIRCPDIHP
jgi:xanthine dehydrogenase large subunit